MMMNQIWWRQNHGNFKLCIEYSNYCRCFHTLVGTRYHSKNILNGIFTLIFKKNIRWMRFNNEWLEHGMLDHATLLQSVCFETSYRNHYVWIYHTIWILNLHAEVVVYLTTASFDLLWITSFRNEARALTSSHRIIVRNHNIYHKSHILKRRYSFSISMPIFESKNHSLIS